MIKKLYCLNLLLSMMTVSCATGSPQTEAQNIYRSYMNACEKENDRAAQELLMTERQFPCSDQDDDEMDRQIPEIVLIAQRDNSVVAWRDRSWHLLGFEPDSPSTVLKRLRFAIKNANITQLSELTGGKYSLEFLETWLASSNADEMYAALALHPAPWILVENREASCEVSGRIVHFVYSPSGWIIGELP